MKKYAKYLLLLVITFITAILPVNAKEMTLKELATSIETKNEDADFFYLIGEYAYSSEYILDTQDIMLAARSIKVADDGDKKSDTIFGKMTIFVIERTYDGMTPTGWEVATNYVGTDTITMNTTIDVKYVDYEEAKVLHKVHFNSNGGDNIPFVQVEKGNKLTELPTPEREGYNFVYWYKDSENTEFKIEDNPINEDIILNAKWEIKKFTITFDDDNTENNTSIQVEYDKLASKPTPDPTKEGYKFLGWFKCTNEDCTVQEENTFDFNTHIKEDVKLKAKWEQIKRTVVFKGIIDGLEDNKFVEGKEQVELTYPFKLTDNQIPETNIEGYVFNGWYDDKSKIDILTNRIFTNDTTTITGKWEIKKFTVTFDTDGGDEIGEEVINYNEKVTTPGEAHKNGNADYNGYKFIGWFKCTDENCTTQEENEFDFNTQIKEDIKLKAKYEQVVYTNKIINNFVELINNDSFSAVVNENTNMVFNIINREELLSTNFDKILQAINKAVNIDNVKNITIEYNGSEPKVLTSDDNIEEKFKSIINEITAKDYNSAKLDDLYGKTLKVTINLTDDYKNEEEETSDAYNVTFTANYVKVHNEEELKENLTNGKEIIIENWEGQIKEPIEINNDVVIDGNNKEIESNITSGKYTFIIKSGHVSIKDLTLKIDVLKPSEYTKSDMTPNTTKNTIGIKVEENASLTINNFQVKNKTAINSNELTIDEEKLSASNIVINENAAIELHGKLFGYNITYEDEIYGSPAVLASSTATMNIGGLNHQKYIHNISRVNDGTEKSSDTYTRVTTFDHYYKDYNNSYLVYSWYKTYKSMLSFAYLYGENLIVPKVFEESKAYYTDDNGKKLTNWKSRNFSGTKSSEELKSYKVQKNETIYLYAMYEE